jgi:hypothetical protein
MEGWKRVWVSADLGNMERKLFAVTGKNLSQLTLRLPD